MYNNYNGNKNCSNEYTYVHGYGFAPPPPQISEKHMIRFYSNAIAIAAMAMFVVPAIFSPIIYNISHMITSIFSRGNALGAMYSYESNQVSTILVWFASVVIPFILYSVVIKMPFSAAAPLKKPNSNVLIPAVMIGMGMSVIGTFFTSAISVFTSLFGLRSTPPPTEIPESIAGYVLMFLSIVIIPAFFEELVYRGIVMQSLRRFGDGFALLCSSILFAMVHASLEQGAFAFIMALVIGYFTLRTGSLWTGIAIHFTNNFVSVILDTISRYAGHTNLMLIIYILDAVFIVLAVLAVMYLDKNDDTIFNIKESNTASLEAHKMSYFFGSVGMVFLIIMIGVTVISTAVPY